MSRRWTHNRLLFTELLLLKNLKKMLVREWSVTCEKSGINKFNLTIKHSSISWPWGKKTRWNKIISFYCNKLNIKVTKHKLETTTAQHALASDLTHETASILLWFKLCKLTYVLHKLIVIFSQFIKFFACHKCCIAFIKITKKELKKKRHTISLRCYLLSKALHLPSKKNKEASYFLMLPLNIKLESNT